MAVRRPRRLHGADAAGEPRLAPADEAQANPHGLILFDDHVMIDFNISPYKIMNPINID